MNNEQSDSILEFLSQKENIRGFFKNASLTDTEINDILQQTKDVLKQQHRSKKRRIYKNETIKKCAICAKELRKNDIIISKKCMCRTIQIAHKSCIKEPQKKCLVCKKKHLYQKVEYNSIVYDVMNLNE